MIKLLYCFFASIVLASCAGSYNIEGSSNVSMLDGHKLYLKVLKDDAIKNIDSCDIVHGKFSFVGNVDTTRVACVFLYDDLIMPVVLGDGDIVVKIDNTQHTIGGTPLNDKLYEFLKTFSQLQNDKIELVHKQNQAYMNGSDMDAVNRSLMEQDAIISGKMDNLITTFIESNFDNVLGPYIFQMATADYKYPMFEPWIEAILSKATDKFKNDKYVKEYVSAAQRNQDIMNGMADNEPQMSAPDTGKGSPTAPPTPSELASDSIK